LDVVSLATVLIIMVMAAQMHLNWLAFGTGILFLMASRNLKTALYLIILLGTIYIFAGYMESYWPHILIGSLVLAYLMGIVDSGDSGGMGGLGGLGSLLGGGM